MCTVSTIAWQGHNCKCKKNSTRIRTISSSQMDNIYSSSWSWVTISIFLQAAGVSKTNSYSHLDGSLTAISWWLAPHFRFTFADLDSKNIFYTDARSSFHLFSLFMQFTEFNGIQTKIVGVGGEHADHFNNPKNNFNLWRSPNRSVEI